MAGELRRGCGGARLFGLGPVPAVRQALARAGWWKVGQVYRVEINKAFAAIALFKHSHKNIDIDRPGKDSYRLRESACREVLLLGNDRWALMHELRGADEPLAYLLDRLQHCDLVLIEGFKNGGFPNLEVWRGEGGKPTLWPEWPGIVAIAIDSPLPDTNMARLSLADTAAIAAFVLSNASSR